jgi:hypothetical protein
VPLEKQGASRGNDSASRALNQFSRTYVVARLKKLPFIRTFSSKFVFLQFFQPKSNPTPKITPTLYVIAVLPAILFLVLKLNFAEKFWHYLFTLVTSL